MTSHLTVESIRIIGAMTTRPRFMRPRSIGPRLIGPIGSWVPSMLSPFIMIGPLFSLCILQGLIKQVLYVYPT